MEPINFREVRELFSRFCKDSNPPNFVVIEVRERLRQVDWILERVYALQAKYERFERVFDNEPIEADGALGPIGQQLFNLGDEIEIFSEAFYSFSWRLCKAVCLLPGCINFQSVPIREIRNRLIEHPEVRSRGLAYGDPVAGPQIRASRTEDEKAAPINKGLFLNAAQLTNDLTSLFKRKCAANQSEI